jgi:hypothetical protein
MFMGEKREAVLFFTCMVKTVFKVLQRYHIPFHALVIFFLDFMIVLSDHLWIESNHRGLYQPASPTMHVIVHVNPAFRNSAG